MNEETLFHLACEKPPDERAAFLDVACAGDTALRQRLEILLAAHEHPGSFLQSAAQESGNGASITNSGRMVVQSSVQEGPGTVIGPYKLLQQIGEGGMGVVFMAEQTEPIQRIVALKIIKPGMDTRQVVARFEAERQALAMMDHPNIAKVLDAGPTDAGRPFFVMELVKGVPITKYCDEKQLSLRERLELFLPVCQAVQHAHQKGIIHRDIKPNNVVVAEYDNEPVPKVIDFGVAKATAQKLTERTMFTELGQVIGTIEYMSPEQAKFNQLDIDTRTDIYSLGVLLYELLAGSTPFEQRRLREAAFDEVLRIIREEEPPKPSTRLSTAEQLPTIAANRGVEPTKLTGVVRGELDWIVMKALEKDRNRRYDTANSFAIDVQYYLADEPVLACQPSTGYRLRKFVQRNKGPVLAVCLVTFALVGGIVGTTWELLRATKAEADATREAREKTKALHEREAALATAKANETRAKAAQNSAQENLKDALAAVEQMTHVADDRLQFIPQVEPIRRDLLLEALRFYQKFLDRQSDDPAICRETAHAYWRVAGIQSQLGQDEDALQTYRDGFAMLDRLRPPASDDLTILRDRIGFGTDFSGLLDYVGKHEESAEQARRAAELANKLDKDVPDNRPLIVLARAVLADHLLRDDPKHTDKIEKMLKENLVLGGTADTIGSTHHALGALFRATHRLPEAEEAYRQTVKCYEQFLAEHPGTPWMIDMVAHEKQNLAGVVRENQRPTEAEEILRSAILDLDTLATNFPSGPRFRRYLADFLVEDAGFLKELGKTTEAEQAYRRAIAIYENLAKDFPMTPEFAHRAEELRRDLDQFLKEKD